MRPLSADEVSLFPPDFLSAIDAPRIRLVPRAHNPFAYNKILVRGYRIYWPDVPGDFAQQNLETQSVLMHELCHVWQYATGRLSAIKYLFRPSHWRYRYDLDEAKAFDDFPTEKQADLMQDWFLVNNGALPDRFAGKRPTEAQINAIVPFHWFPDDDSPWVA